jgi:hypothetical protein
MGSRSLATLSALPNLIFPEKYCGRVATGSLSSEIPTLRVRVAVNDPAKDVSISWTFTIKLYTPPVYTIDRVELNKGKGIPPSP